MCSVAVYQAEIGEIDRGCCASRREVVVCMGEGDCGCGRCAWAVSGRGLSRSRHERELDCGRCGSGMWSSVRLTWLADAGRTRERLA